MQTYGYNDDDLAAAILTARDRGIGQHSRYPFTLQVLLRDWWRFVSDISNPQNEYEDWTNEAYKRDMIEFEFKPGAPRSLKDKIDAFVAPWDEKYREATAEVSEPWFGTGGNEGWWWYRCPKSWWHYRQDQAKQRRPARPKQ